MRKSQFLIQKRYIQNFLLYFFLIFCYHTGNAGSGSGINKSGSVTLPKYIEDCANKNREELIVIFGSGLCGGSPSF
jgi:hypothetical protein